MRSPLQSLSRPALEGLAAELESGRAVGAGLDFAVRHHAGPHSDPVAFELRRLLEAGTGVPQVAHLLRILADERERAQRELDRVQLVWTGPEVPGSESRDTSVVVNELFAAAEESVLVSGYAVAQGKRVFAALAQRTIERSDLRVRLFLNVQRPYGNTDSEASLLREFADRFRTQEWPGTGLPDVFFDPRALEAAGAVKSCLHAKCVVIDESRALFTSANFTEAAMNRNIEAGILVHDASVARALSSQFEALVARGLLRRVPGLGS